MKKSSRKLALHRDTVRTLSSAALAAADGAGTGGGTGATGLVCTASIQVSCAGTCNLTRCGCPTLVQNCTNLC